MSIYSGVVNQVQNFLAVPYDIPVGNLASYFPETNPLIPINEYARDSQAPISKSVRVTVSRM